MSYSYRQRRTSPAGRRSVYNSSRNRRPSNKGKSQYIDPSRFIKVASAAEAETYMPTHKFTDFELDNRLQQNLARKGYDTPSPVQDQTIPHGLDGKDVIGIASTGTGKTASFALPVLQKLLSKPHSTALIIAPTRELAQQIEEECRGLAAGTGMRAALLIGGTNMGGQLRELRARPQIIIGTPGRTKDHLQRGTLKLHNCDTVVLDEVDRMLDMGFINDVTAILKATKQERQSFFFSATMEPKVRTLMQQFTSEPVTVMLQASAASENVHQNVVHYQTSSDQLDKLHDILIKEDVSKVIVFDETKRRVERLSKELLTRGFSADALHGGKTQGQRKRALTRFKKSEVQILVATDVAARGLDVADITHVINYSVPKMYDDYIHRIGRAGRAGKIGHALTFVPKQQEGQYATSSQ